MFWIHWESEKRKREREREGKGGCSLAPCPDKESEAMGVSGWALLVSAWLLMCLSRKCIEGHVVQKCRATSLSKRWIVKYTCTRMDNVTSNVRRNHQLFAFGDLNINTFFYSIMNMEINNTLPFVIWCSTPKPHLRWTNALREFTGRCFPLVVRRWCCRLTI